MAKQIITKITDDLDGTDADETLRFALDGIAYEIDLTSKNASVLRKFLATYQDAGTRLGRVGEPAQLSSHRRGGSSPSGPRSGVNHPTFQANKELNQRIRGWAADKGHMLHEKGRIPQYVVDAFHSDTTSVAQVQADLLGEFETPPTEPAEPAASDESAAPPQKRTRKASPVKFRANA